MYSNFPWYILFVFHAPVHFKVSFSAPVWLWVLNMALFSFAYSDDIDLKFMLERDFFHCSVRKVRFAAI